MAMLNNGYAILRIKRKRTDEPLDALLIESRTKKSRSSIGVASAADNDSPADSGLFQFAETVERSAWDSTITRDRLSALANAPASESLRPSQSSTLCAESSTEAPPISTSPSRQRAYRIVKQPPLRRNANNDDELAKRPSKPLTAPPPVLSSREVAAQKAERERENAAGVTVYDAVLDSNDAGLSRRPRRRGHDARDAGQAQENDEMDKFMPMLRDYLNINDIDISPRTSADTATTTTSKAAQEAISSGSTSGRRPDKDQNDDDYVYDVFVHRVGEQFLTSSAWNALANVGTVSGIPNKHGDGDSSSDDSEVEDEADEDSNDENFYKNEYPDESDGDSDDLEGSDSSDLFHEDSEYEDVEEHEWR